MTTLKSSKSSSGRIIADTRPGRADIYLDGEAVLDSSGQMAKTPTVIYDVTKGVHTVTFSKSGYGDITVIANVLEGADCHTRAFLNTSMMSYPLMLSEQLQPSPGWPYLPIEQVTYGHMVADSTPYGADIYIDGQPVRDINGNIATTPSSVTGIITGIHIVTFKKVGYMDTSIIIDVQNGLYSDAYALLKKNYE
jgi:hypothetical protein